MPQFSNLVLKDQAATPADHTFIPRDIVDNVATWEEATGVPVGAKRITASLSRTTAGRRKASIKGTFPITQEQSVSGVTNTMVVRNAYFDLTFAFAENSTEAERKDVVAYLRNALDTDAGQIYDLATKLQSIY